jgi:ABC-type uncharacterized transport system permease subunit
LRILKNERTLFSPPPLSKWQVYMKRIILLTVLALAVLTGAVVTVAVPSVLSQVRATTIAERVAAPLQRRRHMNKLILAIVAGAALAFAATALGTNIGSPTPAYSDPSGNGGGGG